jgi:hypothetical protein
MKTDLDKLKAHLRPTTVAEVSAVRDCETASGDELHEAGYVYALEWEMRADFWATAVSLGLETPWVAADRVALHLEVSRPYASMLMDSGKLGEVRREPGTPRCVQLGAVLAYLVSRNAETAGAPSPREAGADAGLYALSDDAVANAGRRLKSATCGRA